MVDAGGCFVDAFEVWKRDYYYQRQELLRLEWNGKVPDLSKLDDGVTDTRLVPV